MVEVIDEFFPDVRPPRCVSRIGRESGPRSARDPRLERHGCRHGLTRPSAAPMSRTGRRRAPHAGARRRRTESAGPIPSDPSGGRAWHDPRPRWRVLAGGRRRRACIGWHRRAGSTGRAARGAPMGRKRASLARISSSLAYRSVPIARRRAVMAQPGPGRGVEVIAITPCGRRHGLPIRLCLLDSPHVRRSGVRPVEAGWRTPAPGRRAGHQGVSCPAALSQMTQRTTARGDGKPQAAGRIRLAGLLKACSRRTGRRPG